MDNHEHLRPKNPDQPSILIADDEVLSRNVARLTLESEGYFVLTADDGEEALEISCMRIPRDADQRSDLMSITVPK